MSPEGVARIIAEALVDCTDRPGDDEPVFADVDVDGDTVYIRGVDGSLLFAQVVDAE